MQRFILAVILATSLMATAVVTGSANNDPFSPGDNCSQNSNAIGQPDRFENINATNIVEALGHSDNPVDRAASASNPGVSTGAQGEAHFNGGNRCAAQ